MTEETSTSQVPLLDLAPKLKRPLSLWNPFDYLLLLYWVFYFPQAIRWYVETYCEPAPESDRLTWQQRWQLVRNSPRKRHLALMGLLLEISVPILICFSLESFGVPISWDSVAFGVAFGVASGVAVGLAFGVASGVAVGLALGVAVGLALGVALGLVLRGTVGKALDVTGGVAFGVAFGVASGVALGVALGVAFGVDGGVALGVTGGVTLGVTGGVTLGVTLGMVASVRFGVAVGVALGVTLGVTFAGAVGVTTLRPDNRGLSFGSTPRITPLILSRLTRQLDIWLKSDWQSGLMNINQLLQYSLQFVSVDVALNKELNRLDSSLLISRIATLSDFIWDWKVLRYTSASLTDTLKAEFVEKIIWLPYKSWFASRWGASRELRFDTDAHTAAAGFWYLYEASEAKEVDESISNLTQAVKVFENLRQIRHGDEMYKIVKNLRNYSKPTNLEELLNIPSTEFPNEANFNTPNSQIFSGLDISDITVKPALKSVYLIPISFITSEKAEDTISGNPPRVGAVNFLSLVSEDTISGNSPRVGAVAISRLAFDLLRPQTWNLISKLSIALSQIQTISRSTSRTTRSYALNRALGQITEVLKIIDTLTPEVSRVEKPILKDIAILWRDILLSAASEIGQIEIDKPIANPYTIGDPVIGDRFIGREDILRRLEEIWFINTNPQSVILYGHRRMGKTSILRNATTKVNSEVRVAYVNLLSVSSAKNGITDILMAICDALEEVTEIPVPSNNDLLQFPENTFRRYLEQITKTFTGKGLIIALDEFEKIEELIDAGKLSKDFLGFLRGMVHMNSKIAFAFAGLHTLQEMNADYFQPFYASFYAIPVAFLTREATHQVLANPDPEFLLEYEPAALDHIYDLTNGQPYLTQLIGFQLVRMFNDYVFEQGKPRDRTFTIDDVRTICSGENFFNTGINYFNGVWQQASEGATHQQDILKALAPHPQGLTESELISQSNLPSESLQAALKTLKDHDVIRSQKTNETVNWAIAVKLFRTWVVKYKLSD
jgi:AAA+ ATPase superfamily predicted ATPase